MNNNNNNNKFTLSVTLLIEISISEHQICKNYVGEQAT